MSGDMGFELATQEEQDRFSELVLQRIKLASRIDIGLDTLHDVCENATLKTTASWYGDRMVLMMHSYILAMPETRITARWPATWLDAVLERFAPRWVLRIRPVAYVKIDQPQFENVYLSLYADQTTKFPDGKRLVVKPNGEN